MKTFTQKWYYWVFCILGGTLLCGVVSLLIDCWGNWSAIFAPAIGDPNVIVITTGRQVGMFVGLLWGFITISLEYSYRNSLP